MATSVDPAAAGSSVRQAIMLDRTAERHAVRALLTSAAAGTGGALLLCGDLGAGKTTLLRYAAAKATGFAVLAVDGGESEAALPFAGLHRLLPLVLQHVDGPVRGETERLIRAIEAGCRDDERIGLVLTSVDDGAAGPALPGVPACRLAPLDDHTARKLVERLVSADDVASALVAVAHGNPRALVELAGSLSPEQQRGDAPPPTRLPPGSVLRRAPATGWPCWSGTRGDPRRRHSCSSRR
jgi:hypothetical protein